MEGGKPTLSVLCIRRVLARRVSREFPPGVIPRLEEKRVLRTLIDVHVLTSPQDLERRTLCAKWSQGTETALRHENLGSFLRAYLSV